ncbi:MAG: penicillin acylase family protein [Hyphomonas sp.]
MIQRILHIGGAGFLLLGLIIPGFLVSSCASTAARLSALESIAPPAPYRIERDAYGVPTIYGETDAATAFGLAYAHAEDDFATIQRQVLAVRGELGAVDGRAGAEADYFGKLIDVKGQLAAGIGAVSPQAREMAQAYADGLNLYAARHPRQVLRRQVFPITGEDVIGGFVLVSPLFFGVDDTVSRLFSGRDLPPDGGSEERGSNAFAFAPHRTADQSTILVSNSHQPWEGAAAWYEARVASGEGWSMQGALFPGSPVILMGHNEHLGWTNTVNRADLVDVYELVLDKTGKRYRLDGAWQALEHRHVWLKVKMGPVTVPVRQSVWGSVHGPVIKNGKGAFAIRYAGFGETRQFEQYYRLNRTENLAEWREVMAMQAIPATNFIYADRLGNIAFLYNVRLPKRDPAIDWSGLLPGDDSALIWTEYEPPERIPFLINPYSGYIVNANNTPWLATEPEDDMGPGDYPGLVGVETWETNRILRAKSLLEGGGLFDDARIHQIKFDKGYERTSRLGEAFLAAVADARAASSQAEAVMLLDEWDWTLEGEGAADSLALIVKQELQWTLYRREDPRAGREIVADAADHLRRHFGRLDVPYTDFVRLRRGLSDYPLAGGPEALRALMFRPDADGRYVAVGGDSFIMTVKWPKYGAPETQTIYPFGAAMGRPDSAHYADQAEMFSQEAFKVSPLPVYE